MNISRRHPTGPLPVLGFLAIGLSGVKAAQVAQDAKAFDGLCAAELSYSHSDAHIEDKATFIKNATAGTSKFVVLDYKDPTIRVVGDTAIVRFHWIGESETIPDGKTSSTDLHIPDDLAEARRRLEIAGARVHQTRLIEP